MSTLYIVATPIGNLEDITLRALNVLKSVDVIACEDTRHTSNLLSKYDIKKRTIACHAHNELNSAKGIIQMLDDGLNIAYCSDAGTPGISDPGARLCDEVRNTEHDIVPIPGCSAGSVLVSAAGYIGKTFTFEGFLSPKSGRRAKRLAELISRNEAFIIYESPFRVLKTLEEVEKIDNSVTCVMGRELTKNYEEIVKDSVSNIIELLKKKDSIKGEFALLIYKDDNNKEDKDS